MKAKLLKTSFDGWTNYYLKNENDITIGSTKHPFPPEVKLIAKNKGVTLLKLSLENCQAIERGYDLDELVRNYLTIFAPRASDPDREFVRMGMREGFKEGFQKALEIFSDKKFTEQDMRGAYIQGTNDGAQFESMRDYDSEDDNEPWEFAEEAEKEFIQSLQQTEWDVEIVEEKVYDGLDEMAQPQYAKQPKLDLDRCLILKRV